MSRATTKDNYYHIYSRAIDKRDLFIEHRDYLRFMALINICNKKNTPKLSTLLTIKDLLSLSKYEDNDSCNLSIESYVLMPNHFHILAKEIEGNKLYKFMQRVLNAYTKYFNLKYNRRGHLFESSYKFKHVESDTYLSILRDYIDKNPLKIVDPEYAHTDLLYGKRTLNKEEVDFLEKYQYKYVSTSNVE